MNDIYNAQKVDAKIRIENDGVKHFHERRTAALRAVNQAMQTPFL